MADGGHLVPASEDPSKEKTWTETKKRLERFLPDLFKEIFPEAPQETSAPVSAIASPTPTANDNASQANNDEDKGLSEAAAPENEPGSPETAQPEQQQQ